MVEQYFGQHLGKRTTGVTMFKIISIFLLLLQGATEFSVAQGICITQSEYFRKHICKK